MHVNTIATMFGYFYFLFASSGKSFLTNNNVWVAFVFPWRCFCCNFFPLLPFDILVCYHQKHLICFWYVCVCSLNNLFSKFRFFLLLRHNKQTSSEWTKARWKKQCVRSSFISLFARCASKRWPLSFMICRLLFVWQTRTIIASSNTT